MKVSCATTASFEFRTNFFSKEIQMNQEQPELPDLGLPTPRNFSHLNKLFLQALFCRPVTTKEALQDVYASACQVANVHCAMNDLNDFLKTTTEALKAIDFDLRRAHDPNTGTQCYILVNLRADSLAQMATRYNANEIAFFKKLVEKIVTSPDGFQVSSISALSIGPRLKPTISQKDSELLIERLIKDLWIASQDGHLTISLRTMTELSNYLKENFDDRIHECNICMEMLTNKYESCATENCATALHVHCSRQYYAQLDQKACIQCSRAWEFKKFPFPEPEGDSVPATQEVNPSQADPEAAMEE